MMTDGVAVTQVYKEYTVDCSSYSFTVGEKDVESLMYHEPRGEGDAHYVDVYFTAASGKEAIRIFRPDDIKFKSLNMY